MIWWIVSVCMIGLVAGVVYSLYMAIWGEYDEF